MERIFHSRLFFPFTIPVFDYFAFTSQDKTPVKNYKNVDDVVLMNNANSDERKH